jgi:hypothetical protein
VKALLCIDDTDNLESIGTGQLLEKLIAEVAEYFSIRTSFISRHQLFIHEDIAYTSHNSSMCTEFETEESKFREILMYSRTYLAEHSAEGSDPGLCMISQEGFAGDQDLIGFGKRAKGELLQKSDAFGLAGKYPDHVFLSEHGGSGEGVIGALAGCGLRISGMDGKIKGKIIPQDPTEICSVEGFSRKYDGLQVLDRNFEAVDPEDLLVSTDEIKVILWQHRPAVIVVPAGYGDHRWRIMNKRELKTYKIGE